ncbi:MAG: hypothetical protein A3A88_11040 [Nitrospirae bacterium RIFCSPLOWO2_01_FULL_62_17]|nr:MAG: hypothetical protein A3A88_11040 [Nitrospirae bacterium RIFCSPLOWO2_01_FULL_62_17]
MKTQLITRTILIALLALIPWIAASSAEAAGKTPKPSAPPTQSEGRSIVASGAVEDSQEACLARIPKDATSGQRMIAEQSCNRDQTSRQSIQDVPGR